MFLRFAPLGFNPIDEGYVLAQSRRVLLGQVPHRDVISPRPLGSAYLHTLDFLVPLPLLEASRLVALLEVAAYSLLLAWLAYRRPPASWGVAAVAGAAASFFVNLPGEVLGSEGRMLSGAARLDEEGQFLALFQIEAALTVQLLDELPEAEHGSDVFFHDRILGRALLRRLHGPRIPCGSFLAVHKP